MDKQAGDSTKQKPCSMCSIQHEVFLDKNKATDLLLVRSENDICWAHLAE